MKKILLIMLYFIMALFIVGCGSIGGKSQNTEQGKGISTDKTETGADNSSDGDTSNSNSSASINTNSGAKKILVAYFSHSGNTKAIADQIHENVGGDIFEIKPVDSYPTNYNEVVDQAKKEQEENFRPKLATKVDNIDSYDVIFVGYPDWWGTMPMPVFTFLEQYNLSGKTIIPFCTHEGSGLGRSVDDIKKTCPQSTILEGLAVRGSNVSKANKDVLDWLKKIGMLK